MTVYQDCKWWLVAINSWCNANNEMPFDFKELNENKEMWGLLQSYKKKVKDIAKLPVILDQMSLDGLFDKGGILSRYAVACLSAVVKEVEESKVAQTIKSERNHQAVSDVDRWRQDKETHPEKYTPPENLQNLIDKIGKQQGE